MASVIQFVCPRCKGTLTIEHDTFRCPACNETFFLHDDIYSFITKEKQKKIEPFLQQYTIIRNAEGRGSDDAAYYLDLPHIHSPEWNIRRISAQKAMKALREHFQGVSPKTIRVADIGAGNCWLTRLLTEDRYIPYAIDISADPRDGLAAGRHYIRSLGISFTRILAHFDELPFPEKFFDAIIFNASLHYSSDQLRTLHEAFRILNDRGILLVLDSPIYTNVESGNSMLQERNAYYRRYTHSNAEVTTSSYLLAKNIAEWERALNAKIEMRYIFYNIRWLMRPLAAWIRRRRTPATFALLKLTRR